MDAKEAKTYLEACYQPTTERKERAKAIEALGVVFFALEKQIPFEPVVDRKWSRCKCGKLALNYNYCPNCGQKLLREGDQND